MSGGAPMPTTPLPGRSRSTGEGLHERLLVRGVLDSMRAAHAKVVPRCQFVAAYIERHPEYRELLADEG